MILCVDLLLCLWFGMNNIIMSITVSNPTCHCREREWLEAPKRRSFFRATDSALPCFVSFHGRQPLRVNGKRYFRRT
uniref:Putative secreted protein n=1 Tax=Anopheles marajoara TaxID=58244 RepID=A0A2M4CCJ7_9DIPT